MTRTVQYLTVETILAVTVVGALTVFAVSWYQRKRQRIAPTNWESIGKVKSLYIYPLKTGRRYELKTAICTEYGLQAPKSGQIYQLRDRNLMVYKEENNEQYSNNKMLLIETKAFDENHITLNAPGMPTLKIKVPNLKEKQKTDKIGFYKMEKIGTLDCGEEAAKWLSKYILEEDSGLRLGYHNGMQRRNILQPYKQYLDIYPNLRNDATGLYSNITSYLLVNQASIDDLNTRTPEANITANNFRPNILVEGAFPYAEDEWKWIKIGDVILYLAKPCTRCDATTVNPETAVKNENNEPLRTLRKYRMLKDLKNIELDGYRTVMGNNMGLQKGGEVSVGDVVYVGKE